MAGSTERMWDMSYVNNVGQFFTFVYLLVAPTGFCSFEVKQVPRGRSNTAL